MNSPKRNLFFSNFGYNFFFVASIFRYNVQKTYCITQNNIPSHDDVYCSDNTV